MKVVVGIFKWGAILIVAIIVVLIITGKVDEAVALTTAVGGGIGTVFGNVTEFIVKLVT